MTNITPGAGASFAIGTTQDVDFSTYSAALTDFQNDTYTDVGDIESIGDFGDEFTEVTFTGLSDRRTRKFKGSADAGNLSVTVAMNADQAGQQDLRNALEDATQDDYNFRVKFNDGTSGGSDTVEYLRGKVMSNSVSVSGANDIVTATFSVGLNEKPIRVVGS